MHAADAADERDELQGGIVLPAGPPSVQVSEADLKSDSDVEMAPEQGCPTEELPPVPNSDDGDEVCAELGNTVLSPTEPFDPVQAKAAFELRMCGEPPAVPASSASSASSSADGPAVLERERPFV
jgi:hypothetical protein